MADLVTYREDPAAVAQLFRSTSSPVIRHLLTLGHRVAVLARAQVGKDSRQLEQSIVVRILPGPFGIPAVHVIASTPYARLHHEGTPAHVIRPRGKQALSFYWPKAGKVVTVRKVNHPGTRPNRFLTEPLRKVIADDRRRKGIR